jgi:hypothetical protein
MSRNRHKSKSNNHPKPIKKLIDGSSYSPNSIGGRIDLESLREKLFCQELNQTNHNTTNDSKNSQKSIQGEGKA